jgi:hypothetical protein
LASVGAFSAGCGAPPQPSAMILMVLKAECMDQRAMRFRGAIFGRSHPTIDFERWALKRLGVCVSPRLALQ